ncbi:MAG: DUF1080 domain-containing protein [Bryobacteraceae bacterium]
MLRRVLSVFSLTAMACFAQAPSAIQDGDLHGDAPYMLEPGWTALFNGRDLTGWHGRDPNQKNEWFTTAAVFYDRLLNPKSLTAHGSPGDRMINSLRGRTTDLVTDQKFGDMELYLEFMLAQGSNSGIYMHSLYECQIFDSFGSAQPMTSSDGGAIYHRWINEQGVGGSAPRVNASLPPGRWQSYQIWFQAPRFDASGKKIANAKFLRVLYNGIVVQENVEIDGPTRAHMEIPEAAENSLMIQGDHGPVAVRNIYWRPLRPLVVR